MPQTVLPTDVVVRGNISATSITIPAGTVVNAGVSASAAISPTKCVQRHGLTYGQTGTAASATVPVMVCIGATGTIQAIEAGSIAACSGAATITVDLRKNGSSVLAAVITLDSANTARVSEAGSVTTTSLVDGDWLELVIVATAGGGTLGTGLLVRVIVDEDPA